MSVEAETPDVTRESNPPKLPEESILELEAYLAMQRAVSEETRYRIVAELLREREGAGRRARRSLEQASYHLDKLVDVGVVANRLENERGADGLYSYYVATALGEAVMERGVGELIRTEWDALDRDA